jgi:mRNA-degrading endonuclease YafQ of YafQ-DinJ toxin-antitoxin module
LKRLLLPTKGFLRSTLRLTRRNPDQADDLRAALDPMAKDALHPSLKTHKLKGRLAGSWACSAGCDLRMVFQFVQHEGREAILLEAAGAHDEIY